MTGDGETRPRRSPAQLPKPDPGQRRVPAPAGSLRTKMLIEVAVAAAITLQFKAYGKPAYRLASEMRDHRLRSVDNRNAGVPYPPAQIYFFKVIEKLPIKAIELSKQVAAEHYAAARLPVDHALALAVPSGIGVGDEDIRQIGQRAVGRKRQSSRERGWETAVAGP